MKNYQLRFQGKIGEISAYEGSILAVGISRICLPIGKRISTNASGNNSWGYGYNGRDS